MGMKADVPDDETKMVKVAAMPLRKVGVATT